MRIHLCTYHKLFTIKGNYFIDGLYYLFFISECLEFEILKNPYTYSRSKDSDGPKTQFVVTLDSLGFPTKKQAQINEITRDASRKNADLNMDEPKRTPISTRIGKRLAETEKEHDLPRKVQSTSGNSINSSKVAVKRKRTPIRFNFNGRDGDDDNNEPVKKRRSRSGDRKSADKDHRKSAEQDDSRRRDNRSTERERDSNEHISKVRTIKTTSQSKYDNLPPRKCQQTSIHSKQILIDFLNIYPVSSAITVSSNETKIAKKDRCKFYPSCTRGDRCDYYHPSTPCKAFPNCKFGDVCLYIHPKCKFDLTCSRLDCSFTHTPVTTAAPPLGEFL